jgi:hypothetical protein
MLSGNPFQLSSSQTRFSSNFFDYDPESDFTFFTPDELPSDILTPTFVICHPKRCPWGKGIDSRKAFEFRRYDISQSPALTYLNCSYNEVTRHMLSHLIDTVITRSPSRERPTPPGRNMRRVKNGLVMWLDQHIEFVARYLHPLKMEMQSRMNSDSMERTASSHL